MTIAQLRAFAAAAESLNFTHAAQNLGIDQSTLSFRINRLEHELGVQLFIREKKSVFLSEAGKLLRLRLIPILKQLDAMTEEVRMFGQNSLTTIRISSTNYYNKKLFSGIGQFRKLYPHINLEFDFQLPGEIWKDVKHKTADIGISASYEMPDIKELFECVVIEKDEYKAVLPEGHPILKRQSITLSELGRERTYASERNIKLANNLFGDALNISGLRLVNSSDGHPLKSVITQARAGLGIALVPRSVADGAGALHCCIDISDANTCFEQIMFWDNSIDNPNVRNFVEFINIYLSAEQDE